MAAGVLAIAAIIAGCLRASFGHESVRSFPYLGPIPHGPDRVDLYRRAANYVDRILKGEKPADLPVQAPNKYELVVNLKAAKALGLTVPQSILLSANELIA